MFGGQSSTPFGSAPGGFGQTNAAPGFGSPAPAPFGAPAPSSGFGGFGAPAPAPSGFGGGFGTPAPATGFGGFGAPAPAPSGFGSSTGGFGAAPTSSPFGAPASGGLFGSNPAPATGGLFGSAPAPAAGGFGAPTSTFGGGSGFGAAPAPAFGGSTFGAPAPAPTGLFGASPAPATGGFGTSGFGAPATGGFGSPAPAPSTGLFGAPTPAPAGGLFGAPAQAVGAPGGGGTKVQPYQVTNRQDGTSNISLQAITAMPAYENKSFEELRFEDYSQGNRGAGAGAPGGFGATPGFGSPAPAPTGGLFGAPAPAPAFGAPAPAPAPSAFGGFGSSAPAPFGAPAPAPFGATAPAPFGAPAPAPFGAPAPGGTFGSTGFGAATQPANGGLFGAPAPATGGLFGSTPAPAPGGGLFGSSPASGPGAFGAPGPTPGGGLFGAPAPAPFGAPAPASAFGTPAPAPFGGGFGAPAPAPPGGGLFGAPAPSAFGAPAFTNSLFGAPAPAPGSSLFGAPKPASGMFGATVSAAPAPFGYGAPAPSAYGAPAPMTMPPPPPVGAIIPPSNDEVLAAQVAALEKCKKDLDSNDTFRKRMSESATVTAVSLSEKDSLALAPPRAPLSMYRASPKSSAKIRPRGFASPEKILTPSLSRLGSGGKPMTTPDRLVASTATRLVINPSPKPKLKLSLQESSSTSPLKLGHDGRVSGSQQKEAPSGSGLQTPGTPSTPQGVATPNNGQNGYEYYKSVASSPADEDGGRSAGRGPVIPSLTKAEYSCNPPIDVLATLPEADLAAVLNFSVERSGVGRIDWEGAVDIRGTNLDEVVIIEPKSASVYMKDEETGTKPAAGTKLNRSAVITLEGVYAPDTTTESQDKFSRKVERQTKKMGAELINYDPTLGVWKLRVQHFSRYALDEDDDSSIEIIDVEKNANTHFLSGEREGRSWSPRGEREIESLSATPFKSRRNDAVVVEDDETRGNSDKAGTIESRRLSEADLAFGHIQRETTRLSALGRITPQEEPMSFLDENSAATAMRGFSRYIPNRKDIQMTLGKAGICKLLRQGSAEMDISTDFGLRMGSSFRAGWSPDGSFFVPKLGGGIKRCLPRFSGNDVISTKTSIEYLQQHQMAVANKPCKADRPRLSISPGDNLQKLMTSCESIGRSTSKECPFSLLKTLISSYPNPTVIDENRSSAEEIERRRLFAVQQWLVNSCSDEVNKEVNHALSKGSKPDALMSVVSGGNMNQACDTATDLGYERFGLFLTAGPEAYPDVLAEISLSRLPDELDRAYHIICGDMSREEQLCKSGSTSFDWRRFLAMRLSYTAHGLGNTTLANLISEYKEKVKEGLAPFPKARHASSQNVMVESASFRLLSVGGGPDETASLLSLADPQGFTSCPHDFSTPFHVATIVAATRLATPMSPTQERVLIEGYASQLLSTGSWEWAVYVLLCSLQDDATEFCTSQNRAKCVVLQNFREQMRKERAFLEGVGLPSAWFEEAAALRCACEGDPVGYLMHMVKVNPLEACMSLESTLIPNLLFLDEESITSDAMVLLDAFSCNGTLTSAVHELFHINHKTILLSGQSQADLDRDAPQLIERCVEIERTLASYYSGERKLLGPNLRVIPRSKRVPMTHFLAEGLSQVCLLKLRLRGMKAGDATLAGRSSYLHLAKDEDMVPGGISERENFLRWLL